MIKVNGKVIAQNQFPDNTLLLKISEAILENCDDAGYINIHWLYENDAELFQIYSLVRHIQKKCKNENIDIMVDDGVDTCDDLNKNGIKTNKLCGVKNLLYTAVF